VSEQPMPIPKQVSVLGHVDIPQVAENKSDKH